MATSLLTCAIIDDEEINRLTLEHYISLTDSLQLVTSLDDAMQGLNYFRAGNRVDILFLDVQMPQLNGLDLLRVLPEPPIVILTTAHEDFAVDAFDLRVTDYLVKPFDYARFSRAVQRALVQHAAPAATPATPATSPATPPDNDLFVKVNNKMVRINFDEVTYIEALSDYVVIVTDKQKYIVYTTMKALDARLPFDHFVRVHRSYILNMRRIEAIEDGAAVVPGGHHVPIGKSYQEAFFRKLNRI
ncbi:LytR/AlgR family response regulator transcription factor [Hymenobacter weizhouensis]|uniref:LytR/AlgR family response regulator transcription factor n=1 Tax=Hymenobacter sp. YIM 151500-1 TaxID=2987689 RepID=UPI002227784D|nr:LytTR family DNA-binding domain-containing protein [Hymenobacter sp. YIM 151500-1]UYZ62071.1 LytTR family DNA-binding domain-containing protein [Hymenobacter sp. YIM 151500-1]